MQADNDEIPLEHALAILAALSEAGAATAHKANLDLLAHLFEMAKVEIHDLRTDKARPSQH